MSDPWFRSAVGRVALVVGVAAVVGLVAWLWVRIAPSPLDKVFGGLGSLGAAVAIAGFSVAGVLVALLYATRR